MSGAQLEIRLIDASPAEQRAFDSPKQNPQDQQPAQQSAAPNAPTNKATASQPQSARQPASSQPSSTKLPSDKSQQSKNDSSLDKFVKGLEAILTRFTKSTGFESFDRISKRLADAIERTTKIPAGRAQQAVVSALKQAPRTTKTATKFARNAKAFGLRTARRFAQSKAGRAVLRKSRRVLTGASRIGSRVAAFGAGRFAGALIGRGAGLAAGTAARAGGAAAGAAAGGTAGSLGGPAGTVIGLLAGAATGFMIEKTIGKIIELGEACEKTAKTWIEQNRELARFNPEFGMARAMGTAQHQRNLIERGRAVGPDMASLQRTLNTKSDVDDRWQTEVLKWQAMVMPLIKKGVDLLTVMEAAALETAAAARASAAGAALAVAKETDDPNDDIAARAAFSDAISDQAAAHRLRNEATARLFGRGRNRTVPDKFAEFLDRNADDVIRHGNNRPRRTF